jgi:hypothetical protein
MTGTIVVQVLSGPTRQMLRRSFGRRVSVNGSSQRTLPPGAAKRLPYLTSVQWTNGANFSGSG